MADAVWHLIFRLAPSEPVLSSVSGFAQTTEICWDSLFSPEKKYESIYALYIAESLLSDTSTPEVMELRKEPSADLRKVWKRNFLDRGGLVWAVNVSF